METIFAIVLIFTDFDECWNFYHGSKSEQYTYSACSELAGPEASAAPATSLRPKARPSQ